MSKHYVDGFVLPIPKDKLDAYRKIATKASKVWIEHGALECRECVGEDMNAPGMVAFPKGAKAKPEEIIIFAYIVYKSRKDRDRVNAKVMEDPRMNAMCESKDMPFDCKRMFYGGFNTLVAATAKAE